MAEGSFEEGCLAAHNRHRRQHGVQELVWSDELGVTAQLWADRIVEQGYMQNGDNKLLGENILMSEEDVTGEGVANIWYSEEGAYDYEQARWNKDARHFTQMVWRASTDFGVGKARMKNGGKYVIVANYRPGGNNNHHGVFKKNVHPIA
ncbi:Golgi-associated plant pathogenesis-related protein 1-like isoform X2 [Glandiceps talaboti]